MSRVYTEVTLRITTRGLQKRPPPPFGQILTHFSYDLILLPLRKLAEWKKQHDFTHSDIDWMADYTFIRHKDAALGLEISKRYARAIMSRNNALVVLLLMITSVISRQWAGLTICGVLFLLFVPLTSIPIPRLRDGDGNDVILSLPPAPP